MIERYTLDTYPFLERVGDKFEIFSYARVGGERHIRKVATSPSELGVPDYKTAVRKAAALVADKLTTQCLDRTLKRQRQLGLAVKKEFGWDGVIVQPLELDYLKVFVQTGPDEFHEIIPQSDRFGDSVNGEGWSEKFNCYV